MRPVADRLSAEMEKCVWSTGRCPLVANVSARPVSDVSAIRDGLYAQTYSPVRWVESVQTMASRGVEGFIEMGPGKVLAGTIKKIDRHALTLNVEQPADLGQVASFIEQKAEA